MASKRSNSARAVALGGIMAALAVVIMCLGGLIPVATYICPMLCLILLSVVTHICGNRIGWAWYGAVAILGLLMGPDKEAAAVFLFLGYYPILKPRMDKLPFRWVWKLLLFNGAMLLMYYLLMNLMGMNQISEDFQELGRYGAWFLLAGGNLIFIILDRLLGMRFTGRMQP